MRNEVSPAAASGDSSGHEVGYGQPPEQSQFQKGNKMGKGRPKGSKNLKTIVNEALGAKVLAKLSGKTVKLTKFELAIHQLANKASAGDLKAIEKVIQMQEQYGPQEDPAGPSPEQVKIDLDTLRDHLALLDMFKEGEPESDDS